MLGCSIYEHAPLLSPVELPSQVESYCEGTKAHHKEFGDITGNSPADLKDVLADAHKLGPVADEIEHLQLQLANKLDAYHKAAAPLWEKFAERLGYARTYANTHDNVALLKFLLAFRHNEGRHAAAKAAAEPKSESK